MTPLDLLLKVRRIHPTILEPAAATFSMWVEKVRSLETSTPKSLRWSFSSIVFPYGSLYRLEGLAVLPGQNLSSSNLSPLKTMLVSSAQL